jgi:GT2 family glycosyltransferase
MTVGVVLLTMGDRDEALTAAIASVARQRDVDLDVVLVVNGGQVPDLPGVRSVRPARNLGVAGGRNLGAHQVHGEVVFFLDDDAVLPDDGTLAEVARRFAEDPSLGVLSLRVDTPDGGTQRHHVPRLRVGDPRRSSRVTTFLGGASAIRRRVLDQVGGFPEEFMYAHEETSLAWRVIDAGSEVRYAGDLVVVHPEVEPTRHSHARRLAARNRVLLARRHLPTLVGLVYVADWLLISLLRDTAGWRDHLRGTVDGVRLRRVSRRPIAWRTVWRLARWGRPPVV